MALDKKLLSILDVAEPLTNIQSFTVGLAASESDFDDAAFATMLRENLDRASQKEKVRVTREADERQVHKKRISWGPGAELHVEQEVCHACLHESHESHAGSFLLRHQNGATTPLFDCACRQCRP